ncbi:acyl-CoA dehydrogenase family protein, partial [Streptomyces sp. NPDC002577]
GDGELERMNRAAQINTFGGGVSEVQREIVATARNSPGAHPTATIN